MPVRLLLPALLLAVALHAHAADAPASLALSWDQQTLAIVHGGCVAIVDARAGAAIDTLAPLPADAAPLTVVALDPGAPHRLYTGDNDGNLALWTIGHATPTQTVPAHHGPIRALAMSRLGGALLSAGQDGRAYMWDVASMTRTTEFPGAGAPLTSIAWHNRRRVVTAGDDGRVRLYESPSGALLATLPPAEGGAITHLAAQLLTRWAATTSATGVVELWDVEAAQRVVRLAANTPQRGAVFMTRRYNRLRYRGRSYDEPTQLLTWDDAGTVTAWSLPAGQPLAPIAQRPTPIAAATLSLDGRHLFLLDATDTTTRWDTALAAPSGVFTLDRRP